MAIVHQDLDAAAQHQLGRVLDAVPPDELGDEMADILLESIPEFTRSTDEDFRAGAVLSCTSNLNSVWGELRSGAPTEPVAPPHDALAWAHELVHRGMPLAAMLRAYRLGHGPVPLPLLPPDGTSAHA